MTNETDLRLEQALKTFGDVTALDRVDLSVRNGELLTILGPSGSGKTTLLRLVAGFAEPDAGQILLQGRDITYLPPAKRDIGMVFQNYALFPHMTVAENVAFPLRMRKTAKEDVAKRVKWALGIVELGGYEERLPRQLSGGQQQRVAFARAIVFDPRILLLDEPFGALDRKLREQIQLEVRRLQQQLSLTSLFVTHDQEEALILSDRIAVMNKGRIEQLGTPHEIYEKPANRFVADFIGISNLFSGRVEGRDKQIAAVRDEAGRLFRVVGDDIPDAGTDAVVLVRPERLQLLGEGEEAENSISGEVAEIVYLGQSEKLRIETGAGEDVLMHRQTRLGEVRLDVGSRINVGWSAADAHLIVEAKP
ncbi:ABC transporter ATP-binding protein [Thalassospiraceae bacterium LMO-JJ14]|nr:ABC transporter ATP-binding protein [Thalassospiraceae bacterium LMO-JJ14]